jgi:hypothetical protein
MTETTKFDDSLPEGFGQTNYSNTRYETWRLKDDSTLTLGLFPPMKSLLQSGQLFEYWAIHWGWKGTNGDPSKKPFHRPFLCLNKKDYGMTVHECPADVLRKKYQDRVQSIQVRGKELGKDEAAIKRATHKDVDWLREHGVDGKARMYAYDKSGRVGVLEIPYSLAKSLKDEMKKLTNGHYPGTDKNINPTGRVGVFFEFARVGKAGPKSDSVQPHRINKTIQGEEVQVLDFYRIPDSLLQTAQNVLPDLIELRDRQRLSDEQVQQLVDATEAGGGSVEPDVVDNIIGIKHPIRVEQENWSNEMPLQPVTTSTPKVVPQVAEDDVLFGETMPPRVEVKAAPVAPKAEAPRAEVKPASVAPKAVAPVVKAEPVDIEVPVATDSDFDSLFS